MEAVRSLIKVVDVMDTSNIQLIIRMEDCLVRKICQLRNPEEVLEMFLKVVYMRNHINQGYHKFRQLEDRIVKELMKISFKSANTKKVVRFVLGLPYRTPQMLELISYFIEEIEDPESIGILYSLFVKLFPENPTADQIRCLLSISTKEVIEKIHEMTKKGDIVDIRLLEDEAKRKLKKVPKVYNAKGEAIMLFVFYVVFHGGDIWLEIIEWEKTAIREYKDWLKAKAQSIVSNQNSQRSLPLILNKLTNVNYESEISELFFDHVLQSRTKEMLSSMIIKNFLASKLLYKFQRIQNTHQKFTESKLAIFFDKSLIYTDILLQIFNYEEGYSFYGYLMQSGGDDPLASNSSLLITFLSDLYQRQRFKFMEFFLNFINPPATFSPLRTEVLTIDNSKLISYFLKVIDFELAYILSKEMSIRTPSKFYFLFFMAWLEAFKTKSKFPSFKASIVRNVNIVLLRGDLELSLQFINDFKTHFFTNTLLTAEDKAKLTADIPATRRALLA